MIIKEWEFREIALRFIEVPQIAYFSSWTFIQKFHYHTSILAGETEPTQKFCRCKIKPNPFVGLESNHYP
jgi:hypothetical protein